MSTEFKSLQDMLPIVLSTLYDEFDGEWGDCSRLIQPDTKGTNCEHNLNLLY